MERRTLILGAPLSPFLAACTSGSSAQERINRDNLEFSRILEKALGVSDQTSRPELQKTVYGVVTNTTFMRNESAIAKFTNNRGKKVVLGTNELGWPIYTGDVENKPFVYSVTRPERMELRFGSTTVSVIGEQDSINTITKNPSLLEDFTKGFSGTDVRIGIGFNAAPATTAVAFGPIRISYPENVPLGVTARMLTNGQPEYGVLFNLNMIHRRAINLGLTPQQSFTVTVVNEGIDLMGYIEAEQNLQSEHNDAPGTLAGWAAAFNEHWLKYFGDESFSKLISVVGEEMQRLKAN